MYNWKGDNKLYWKEDFPLNILTAPDVITAYKRFVRSTQQTPQYSAQAKSKLDSAFKQAFSSKSVLEVFIKQFL